MPSLQLETNDLSIFPYSAWNRDLAKLSRRYRTNTPGPHIYLTSFVDPEIASRAAAEFPQPDSDAWTHYQHQNENKHGMTKRSLFPPTVGEISDALNSDSFLQWLSRLTGVPNLLADPSLEGGGLASIRPRRISKRPHRLLPSPLQQKLEETNQSHPVSQSRLAGKLGRSHRAMGQRDAPLRREIPFGLQLRIDIQYRRQVISRISRTSHLSPGNVPQKPGLLLLHFGNR